MIPCFFFNVYSNSPYVECYICQKLESKTHLEGNQKENFVSSVEHRSYKTEIDKFQMCGVCLHKDLVLIVDKFTSTCHSNRIH